MATAKEIKEKMALPPIPQAKPTNRSHGSRDRNRVRLEISPKMADWLLRLTEDQLAKLTILEDDFKPAYDFYYLVKSQLDRINKGEPGKGC